MPAIKRSALTVAKVRTLAKPGIHRLERADAQDRREGWKALGPARFYWWQATEPRVGRLARRGAGRGTSGRYGQPTGNPAGRRPYFQKDSRRGKMRGVLLSQHSGRLRNE